MINDTVFGTDRIKEGNEPIVSGDQMVLSHTPLMQLLPKYHDKFVLVSGMREIVEVCVDYGFKKAIHSEELLSLIP